MPRFVSRFVAAVSALILAVLLGSAAASAQSLEWRFKSEHPKVVDIELYSQDRNRVWPGDNEVYTLKDYSTRSVDISCRRGEKICYGAWVRNTRSATWGSGPDDKGSCKSCCFICDGGRTPVLVLE